MLFLFQMYDLHVAILCCFCPIFAILVLNILNNFIVEEDNCTMTIFLFEYIFL